MSRENSPLEHLKTFGQILLPQGNPSGKNENEENLYEKYCYRFIHTFLLCGILSLYINGLWGFILHPTFILLSGFFFTGLVTFIDAFKKKFVLLMIAIASIVLLVIALQVASLSLFQILSESFTWMFHSRNPEALVALRSFVISGGFMLAILVVFIFKIICFYRIRYMIGLALFITTVVLATLQVSMDNLLLFLLFFFLLSVFHEFIVGNKKAITYLLPFILIFAIFVSVIPSSDQRIPWERITEPVTDFFGRTGRRLFDLFPGGGGTEFGVSFMGYTQDGRLRGQILPSEGEALMITGHAPHASLYLAGTIMDTYTGTGWERRQNMDHFDLPEMQLEALELLLTLYVHDVLTREEEEAGDYRDHLWILELLEVNALTIEFLDIRSRSIFHPLRTLSVNSSARVNLSGSTLFFRRPQETGTRYSLRQLSMNYRHESIQYLLINAGAQQTLRSVALEETLEGVHVVEFFGYFNRIPGLSMPHFPIPDQVLGTLEQRRELIYYYYTALPDTIPERVVLLAREITGDYSSNYEKMRAIERFFTENHFTYTTTPPPLPDGDFVDWFLFEGSAGYCTYFATAAAVLGRSIGIPVRYVQGFALPASQESEVIARNLHAHAWIEAYIDHIGWIPFEPTPTFGVVRGNTWGAYGQPEEPSGNVYGGVNFDFHPPTELDMNFQAEEMEEAPGEESIYFSVLLVALALLLVILLGLLLSLYFSFVRRRKKYQNTSVDERFKWLFGEILYLLELQGISISLGETLKEFSDRLENKELAVRFMSEEFPEKFKSEAFAERFKSEAFADKFIGEAFAKITRLHEKITYEKKSIRLEELEVASKFRDDLVKGLQKKHLKIQYWYHISR